MGRGKEEDRFTGPLTAYRLCEGAFEKTEKTGGEGDGGRRLEGGRERMKRRFIPNPDD